MTQKISLYQPTRRVIHHPEEDYNVRIFQTVGSKRIKTDRVRLDLFLTLDKIIALALSRLIK